MHVPFELADEVRWFSYARGPLFVLNTALALIPLLVSLVVFRRGVRPTASWWMGAGLFLLFLPNAAYVITDGVHLVTDIRNVHSDLTLATVYVPGYLAFFAAGFTCYVLALRRVEHYTRAQWPSLPWWMVWCALQGLVGIGVYLGRVTRVHSWHIVTRPDEVLGGLATLREPVPFALLVFTTAVIAVGAMVWQPVVDAALRVGSRTVRHVAPPR
jgi:uncharacterized membrane protein